MVCGDLLKIRSRFSRDENGLALEPIDPPIHQSVFLLIDKFSSPAAPPIVCNVFPGMEESTGNGTRWGVPRCDWKIEICAKI